MQRPVAVAAVALALVVAACGNGQESGGRRGRGLTVVSIEFDDNLANQWSVRSLLRRSHVPATFFVDSGTVGTTDHMTWGQLSQLHSSGNEIGGHTVSHPHLPQLDANEQARQICIDREALADHGLAAEDFAYPYGEHDATTATAVQTCGYNSARDVSGLNAKTHAETIPPADPFATRAFRAVTKLTTEADMQRAVTDAERFGGGWVQIVFHNVCDGCGQYAVRQKDFGAFLRWFVAREKTHHTVAKTVAGTLGGGLKPAVPGPPPPVRPGNLLANPSFQTDANHDGVPDCWSTTNYGDNDGTASMTSDAYDDAAAERIDVTRWTSGDRKVVVTQDLGACAPLVAPGRTYSVLAYYKASAPAFLTAFYRTRDGLWRYWTDGPPLTTAADWQSVRWTTPPVPDDGEGLSVGFGLKTTGSLTVDDVKVTGG